LVPVDALQPENRVGLERMTEAYGHALYSGDKEGRFIVRRVGFVEERGTTFLVWHTSKPILAIRPGAGKGGNVGYYILDERC
jgi:hypothetical protein